MTTGASRGPVPLRASESGHIATEDAVRLLGPDVGVWLGPPVDNSPSGMRRFAADLHIHPDDAGLLATFHKVAYVDLGPSQRSSGGVRVEISWRSASLAPLFPVFSGWLTVVAGELRLDGYYAPPGGAIGRVADRALLHFAARGTARWLLGQLLRAASATSVGSQVAGPDSEPNPSNVNEENH